MERTYIGIRIFFIILFLSVLGLELFFWDSFYWNSFWDPMTLSVRNIADLLIPAFFLSSNQPSIGKIEAEETWKIRVDQVFLVLFFVVYTLFAIRLVLAFIA